MALFSKKTKKVDLTENVSEKSGTASNAKKTGLVITEAEVKVGIPGVGVTFKLKPRVTEKSALLAERNVYVFDVPKEASKGAISKAVSTIRNAGKVKISRGKKGRTRDSKKAYVYLKKGEKIEIV